MDKGRGKRRRRCRWRRRRKERSKGRGEKRRGTKELDSQCLKFTVGLERASTEVIVYMNPNVDFATH